jgi:RNA polymerase sigma-70 factor, ECF subfamily
MSESRDGWQHWLEEHAGRLLLYARQRCGEGVDAEDVLQDALVEAWSRCGGAEPPPPALVYSTIRRRAIDRGRSALRRSRRERSAADADWFVEEIGGGHDAQVIQGLLGALPEAQREVLVMKIWGALSFREIGEALDIPVNTASSRYRYALEALRGALEKIDGTH